LALDLFLAGIIYLASSFQKSQMNIQVYAKSTCQILSSGNKENCELPSCRLNKFNQIINKWKNQKSHKKKVAMNLIKFLDKKKVGIYYDE
jgi:hypothetical protein